MNEFTLISGASSGIGRSLANRLARDGKNLILLARRAELLSSLQAELEKKYSVEVVWFGVDLVDKEQRADILKKIFGKYCITTIYNNAGIGNYAPFLRNDLDDHFRSIELNVDAVVQISYLGCKHMLDHGIASNIVNIASMASFVSMARYSVYCGTKHFVRSFTEALALEFEKTNISFTCISPGGVATEFLNKAGQRLKVDESYVLMSSDKLADDVVVAVRKKKLHYTPGFLNQISLILMKFLSKKLGNKLATFAMEKATSSDREKITHT